jgi:16S rRNA (guanine527-N7)-methyltransferase
MTIANQSSFQKKLSQLCEMLDFEVTQPQQQKLIEFLEQLAKWNKTYNLTAINDKNKMLTHHIMDSLAVSPYIKAQKIADVGTGAGIPGIPLAILHPDKTFYLIDSNGKKVRFIKQTAHQLGLKNVIALHKRVESVEVKVDVVISRAFASLQDMIEGTSQLLEDNGMFFAMKGKQPQQQLEQISKTIKTVENHNIQVPGLEAERCLLCLQKQQQ